MQRERTAPRRGKNERFRQLPFPHTAYLRETDFQFQTIKIDDNGKERETKHDFDRGVRQETSKTDSRSTIGRTARHGEQLPSYPFQFLPFHTGAEHGIQLGCSDRGALRAVVAKSRRITQQFIILHAQSARHVQPAFQTGRDRRRRTFRRYTGIAKTRKRAVSEQTLARIKQADLTEFPQLARCRDLFLFCFYCRGMAFVDLAYLRQENIDGHYIRYTRRKTGQNLEIHMKEIMLRHAGSGGYLFPILTSDNPRKAYEQYRSAICTFNRSLKILSQRLDIPALSSYMSRHTWATIARYRQIPLAIISEGMGHNSENTTRIYLSSFNQQVLDEANKNVITI